MSSGDKFQVVDVQEFGSNLGSEEPAGTTRGNGPGIDVLGVGPHQVTEGAFVRHFHSAVDQTNLVQSLDLGGQTSVDAENFALDDGTDAEVVEDFAAVLPGVHIAVLAHGLLVEAVDGCDTTSLMVTSEESDAVGPLELQAEKELEGLHRVVTTIDEITHEDVASVGDLTTFFKQFEQIVELSVDVAADSDRGAHRLHIALLDQNFLDLLAQDA